MSDVDDIDPVPDSGTPSHDLKSPKKPYSKLAVELSDDDLKSPGVQKMLLAEISRLEHHVLKFDANKDSLSEEKTKVAVLEKQNENNTTYEVLYSAGLSIGAALVGLTPSISSSSETPYVKLIVLVFGVILIGLAVAAKWRQK